MTMEPREPRSLEEDIEVMKAAVIGALELI